MPTDPYGQHLDHITGHSPHRHHLLDAKCSSTAMMVSEHHHNFDLVTTLRSELAALSYKRDRLSGELADTKSSLCTKDSECETLRAQAARQSALIGSLQGRLQAAENREQSVQERCDCTIDTIQREKRNSDDRGKELQCKVQHLETHLANEEAQKEQAKIQLNDFVRRFGSAIGLVDLCENAHQSVECVVARAEELMVELQRNKAKISSTCDTLSSAENELLNLKSLANIEKQRLSAQLEAASSHNHELEGRCRQLDRDLQIQRDRLTESEITTEKLSEELRGFESRCHRLQNNMDRAQNERLQFLRCLANQLNVPEPCETLIKDKLRETLNDNQAMHLQMHKLRDQLSSEHEKLKETQETTECRLRSEEAEKSELEERLEKCHVEIKTLRNDHLGLSEFLQRLARALCWSECSSPPSLGADTNILAESLLERADRLAAHVEHAELPNHTPEKGCCDHHHHHLHHHAHTPKLRRERSCHDIPLKESSSIYNLQRRIRVLREQVQRRDLHLELLRRKLAIIEDGARGRCALQGERDEAVCRAKKAAKHIDKLTAQLVDARQHVAEVKAQLSEAVEYKISSLERARKIDDLTAQMCDLEEVKTRLLAQLSSAQKRLKASGESAQNRRSRDEALIHSLRDDINRLQAQLSDANHRLSHLQSFRTSVARTLHLRDLPETDLLHRLQALCSAHQEFTLVSKRYETASPVGEHSCPRFDDPVPPSLHCRAPPPPAHPDNGHGTAFSTHNLHNSSMQHSRSSILAAHRHGKFTSAGHHHQLNAERRRSKSREKRSYHDECFESDIHRHHCKEELLAATGASCDDDFDFKGKFC